MKETVTQVQKHAPNAGGRQRRATQPLLPTSTSTTATSQESYRLHPVGLPYRLRSILKIQHRQLNEYTKLHAKPEATVQHTTGSKDQLRCLGSPYLEDTCPVDCVSGKCAEKKKRCRERGPPTPLVLDGLHVPPRKRRPR